MEQMSLQRSWPAIAAGVVLVIAVSAGLMWYALSGTGRHSTAAPAEVATSTVSVSSTSPLVMRTLDGVMVSSTDELVNPFAVMIDNHPDARPPSGINQASVVVQSPVEGGYTRFMAVFDASTTVPEIGPVRSARPYFVDLAAALHAVYTHVGGSPDALTQITNTPGFHDLNQFFNGDDFWRDNSRAAPHNVYTSTTLLNQAADAKGFMPTPFTPWRYQDVTTSTATGTDAAPDWKFDPTDGVYVRTASPTVDRSGAPIEAVNLVVIQTDMQVIDTDGRLKIRTTGRGDADVYVNGVKHSATWYRASGDWYSFETNDGTNVTFDRGTTWIILKPTGGAILPFGSTAASSTSL